MKLPLWAQRGYRPKPWNESKPSWNHQGTAGLGMSHYDEHEWWVAKQVIKYDSDKLNMPVDIESLKPCGTAFQSMFLTAAQVPDSISLEHRLAIVVCSYPYPKVGPSLLTSLDTTEPTIMEWIAFGKWLGYDIPPNIVYSRIFGLNIKGFYWWSFPSTW